MDITKSNQGHLVFIGKNSNIVFGVELHELNYDQKRQTFKITAIDKFVHLRAPNKSCVDRKSRVQMFSGLYLKREEQGVPSFLRQAPLNTCHSGSFFASGYSASVTGLHKYLPFQWSWDLRSLSYHSLHKTQFLKFKPY